MLAGISAAIAAIPEEPPVLLAVILGLGAYRLLRRGVLVRRLNAEETLGAIDLILTDKTGTLTQNRLEVAAVSPRGATRSAEQPATCWSWHCGPRRTPGPAERRGARSFTTRSAALIEAGGEIPTSTRPTLSRRAGRRRVARTPGPSPTARRRRSRLALGRA